jgi:hypothetical protein
MGLVMRALPSTLSALVILAACDGTASRPTPPPDKAVVTFVYASRFPSVCPNAQFGSLCYASCAHHVAPLGLAALLPSWSDSSLRLISDGPKRWTGTLFDVPVGVPLRVRVSDIDGCCFGDCQVATVHDLYANGVLLQRVVGEGATAELEFRVGPDGAVIP